MDHLIGQRFNLVSKSEIRYLGTLHDINPDEATIALENVRSFGTEDRKVERFIPPSQHHYEYIVFRAIDVNTIKMVEDESEEQSQTPQHVPNDPAIVNATRPGPSQQGPPQNRGQSSFAPGYPQPLPFGNYYPPPNQFGRGFGPPPGNFGPGGGFMPYGPLPPPGYFGHPPQGFPHHQNPFPNQPPLPIGPPSQRPQHQQAQQPQQQAAAPPAQTTTSTSELPVESKDAAQKTVEAIPSTGSSQPPKPTEMTSAAVTTATTTETKPPISTSQVLPAPKQPPTGPKNARITPAIPFAVNQKTFTPPASTTTNGTSAAEQKPTSKEAPTRAAMEETARRAKEAVANAAANIAPQPSAPAKTTGNDAAMEALTKKVNEMSTQSSAPRGRGSYRGGRGGHHRGAYTGPKKIDIPRSDYDFESANAKFSKEDVIKEAIATGSPIEEPQEHPVDAPIPVESPANGLKRKDSHPLPTVAYNKSSSFFDNISSEAKDREDGVDGRANARAVRGEEFKKNMETFGQGNVDGGYRGRGRGGFGRGRQYGSNYRGYNPRGNINYRGRGGMRGGAQSATVDVTLTGN